MLSGHVWPLSVPYSCDWLQNLHSVPAHLAVATGHLFSPLLFFPAQVTYPGRITPRLCTLHSFLTSFLFSMPGGSWTVSSLACKCICASSIQWSHVCLNVFLFLPAFLSVPMLSESMPFSPDLWDHCWLQFKLPDFPKWRQEWSLLYFFLSVFLPSCPTPLRLPLPQI